MPDGWEVKVCVGETTIDGTSVPIEITSESMKLMQAQINTQGMYGTRSQHKERTKATSKNVGGQLSFEMSPNPLVFLLPMILGADASGTTFALAETMQDFQLQIDRSTKVFTYADCMVNKATFKGQPGGFVNVTLDLIGVSETVGNSGTGQSLTTPIDAPYIFEEGVLTLGGTGYTMMDFELVIDNKLQARFGNSLTATRISPADLREITLSLTNPYTSTESGLYNPGVTSVAGTLVFTNGGLSTTFTFPALQAPAESPVAQGKGEIPMKLKYVARMTSTTAEFSVTHDSTP